MLKQTITLQITFDPEKCNYPKHFDWFELLNAGGDDLPEVEVLSASEAEEIA